MDHQVALWQHLRRELQAHLSRQRGLRRLIEASEAKAGGGICGARFPHRRRRTLPIIVNHMGSSSSSSSSFTRRRPISFPTNVPSNVATVLVERPLVAHVHREASGEADVGLEQPAAQVLLMDDLWLLPPGREEPCGTPARVEADVSAG